MDQITKTGMLTMAFGATLFSVLNAAKATGKIDPRTSRELAVLSRILEKRLGEMRLSLPAATGRASAPAPAGGSARPALAR